MIIYGIAVFFSLLFAYVAETYSHNVKKDIRDFKHIRLKRLDSGTRLVLPMKKIKLNKKNFFVFLSFLPLYVVSAVRYLVGTDYAGTYKQIYDYTYRQGIHWGIANESLYALLNRIAGIYSGSDYVGVFALSSLLVCGFVFWGIKRQSVDFFYSVLFFIAGGFYFWSFNGVRQAIAMAIFLYSLQYVESKEFWKYCVCIIMAFGFHKISILYFIVYFCKRIRIDFRVMLAAPLVILFSAVSLRQLAYMIASKIQILKVYVKRYLGNMMFDNYTEASFTHAYINMAVLGLYLLIAFIYDRKQKKCNLWLNLQLIATGFSLLANVLPLANRLSRLFAFAQILSVPYMTGLITDKRLRVIVNVGVVFCFSLYTFVTYFVLGYHDILPYRTIFSRNSFGM